MDNHAMSELEVSVTIWDAASAIPNAQQASLLRSNSDEAFVIFFLAIFENL